MSSISLHRRRRPRHRRFACHYRTARFPAGSRCPGPIVPTLTIRSRSSTARSAVGTVVLAWNSGDDLPGVRGLPPLRDGVLVCGSRDLRDRPLRCPRSTNRGRWRPRRREGLPGHRRSVQFQFTSSGDFHDSLDPDRHQSRQGDVHARRHARSRTAIPLAPGSTSGRIVSRRGSLPAGGTDGHRRRSAPPSGDAFRAAAAANRVSVSGVRSGTSVEFAAGAVAGRRQRKSGRSASNRPGRTPARAVKKKGKR